MKYFSAILLIFATILGIVSCILPYWSMGNTKQITSGVYNLNTGKNMNAGLWGYCYNNIGSGSTALGNAGCGTFDIDSWPTNEISKGLLASRYLSIISISLTALTAVMVYFTQNKTAYIVMCSLIAALILSLLVVYYVVQQPLLSSMHNNYKCLGAENCTGGVNPTATAKNYGNLCTVTKSVCQVCGTSAAGNAGVKEKDLGDDEWDVTAKKAISNPKYNKDDAYDVRNLISCTSEKDCKDSLCLKKNGDGQTCSTDTAVTGKLKCTNGYCVCPKEALISITDPNRSQYCTNDTTVSSSSLNRGAAGLYLSTTATAPDSDCSPSPGACMYIQVGAALLVIGSIFALPGIFNKKSSKSK
jgi:hypothetical protein